MTGSRLKKYLEPQHRGIVPDTFSQNKKVYCPLCKPQQDIKMEYNEIKQSWLCGHCGHQANPKLSQITLSTSELKASNDFYLNRKKVFIGAPSRRLTRIESFPLQKIYRKTEIYQNLMEANEASEYHDPDQE